MPGLLTPKQFNDAVGDYGWRVVGGGACICFHTGSFRAGGRLAEAISGLDGTENGHVDVDLRADVHRRAELGR